MKPPDAKALGRQVAFHRSRLGLSQRELAARLSRSESWVSQVERGVRQVDRMSVLEKIAEVLDVPLSELATDSVVAAPERPRAATALSLALCSSDALHAVLSEVTPVDVQRLSLRADQAWEFAHESRHEDLSHLLGTLIPELEYASRKTTGANRRHLCAAKAKAYHAAAGVLSKLGETAAAWVAVDRSIAAAEDADDPLLMGAGAFRLAIVFQQARRFDLVKRTATTAITALSRLAEKGDLGAIALSGALFLQLSVASARSNEGDEAYSYLAKAGRAAKRIGADTNNHNTEFGPTNVALHEISIAVELGDAGRALRVAEKADVSSLSPERQAQMLIDVARAHAQRRQTSALLETLRKAYGIAPEQVSAHPTVHDLVRDALRDGDINTPDLRKLASALNIVA
ncbi:helix-turn-helix domain-containing protein [Actinokineospora sp.]|uniref:helix-turn-helix domain-containing protein n=1 Tax=Actinokineospora sp. TaxID=1872133 RepID=UPI003D6B29A3